MGRYKIINDKINAESDPKEKERMQGIKNDISKELKEWDNKFDSMVDNGKISGWEKDFILWNFLKPINEQFPKRHFELDDYFDSRFGRMQLPKD